MAKMTLPRRCQPIEALVLDVDGVLTDGGIIYTDRGDELKVFNVRDGSGLTLWQKLGKKSALITGRRSEIVVRRGMELGMKPIVQGADNKLTALQTVLKELKLKPEEVCYVGDDVPDLGALREVGLAVAVADACPEALEDAHYVTAARGGQGAVREVIELILKCQGTWDDLVAQYRGE
jgi:3-deoxy-D-manno-octulosonate 8-phosphate phosphatase (KDO 8-P phosphatase)